uniref:Small ribosomal subunit protein uS4c n=1 Tax=Pleurastrosarcina brevispinosa TaxID=163096 RepID=A0A097KN60_9CHLO|nr:ribosomal protein S4 [Chlorosarcina brevispinosa]
MSRYRGPRLRIVRRLGILPGLTRKKPTRETPPGQHGTTDEKFSFIEPQYRIRLEEKQKLRFNYGITEGQLLNYVRQARKIKGSTGEILLSLLEMRLDNVAFRLGLAPTIGAARQLITHGHISVNNKKVNIPSYQCKPKDIISVSQRKQSRDLVLRFLETADERVIPPHLTLSKEKLMGLVNSLINREWVGLNVNELLVVEYYSRK